MKLHTNRWQHLMVVALIAAVLQSAGRGQAPVEAAGPRPEPAPTAGAPAVGGVTRTLVVHLGSAAAGTRLRQTLTDHAAASNQASGLAELGYTVLQVPAGEAAAVQANLQSRPEVLSVEVAQPVFTADQVPNDPQWNMQYGPSRIQAPRAWDTTTGAATVTIAIIDTGLDLEHPDLAGNLWTNPGEIAGNGRDDDDNGFVDDVHGWDWYSSDNDPSDDHRPGHGTHVAGIAAAASNNGMGIAGVAWNVKLMPLKVLGSSGGGSDWAVAEAILYAARHGARVINLSLAGRGLGSYVESAVNFATSQGALVVAAAGNEGNAGYSGLMQPAAYANAVGVAATDEGDQRTSYSNYGPEAGFAAPGHNIYSTLRGGYGHMSGTSMAAPHVAGAAALLASLPQFNSVDRIRAALRLTAVDAGSPGWDVYYGWGRVQVANAMLVNANPLPACVEPQCWRLFLPMINS